MLNSSHRFLSSARLALSQKPISAGAFTDYAAMQMLLQVGGPAFIGFVSLYRLPCKLRVLIFLVLALSTSINVNLISWQMFSRNCPETFARTQMFSI